MRIPGWLFILGVVFVVGVTALCSLFSFSFTRQVVIDLQTRGVMVSSIGELVQAITGGADALPTNAAPFTISVQTATPMLPPAPTSTPEPGATLGPTDEPTLAPTTDPAAAIEPVDPRRFTILLLGIDQRTGVDEQGPFRTDTMMVISVDPVRKTAGVLSIPRDLWVQIPGFQPQRINQANSLGESSAYPGGGPALAAATVQQNLGLRIDKYLLVNFTVFTTIVDTLAPNGVEVCPPEAIDDPHYPDAGYGTIVVHFNAGCQTLDAERLLQYARTRATFGGDFDRARRQQEVLNAVRAEVLSVGGVTNFLGQAPALWDELSGSFVTNLTLEEIISLGRLMQDIPRENIRFGVIDNLYVELATTTTGDQVLIPNHNAIRLLIQQVFNPQEALSLSDLRTRAEAENATIAVFNNTDVTGLANNTSDWLASRGVSVASVGNTAQPGNADTVIQVYTTKTWTARYLAALLGLTEDRIRPGQDGLTTEDIAVVVGPDIQPLLSGG
jgi:LCP family protein required for cell wall assembly